MLRSDRFGSSFGRSVPVHGRFVANGPANGWTPGLPFVADVPEATHGLILYESAGSSTHTPPCAMRPALPIPEPALPFRHLLHEFEGRKAVEVRLAELLED